MLRMFRQLDEKRQNDESGFTLIELLVVIIIIGILAAIAIPVFLSQRERAWRSASQSDLRNASVAMETYYTDEGVYNDGALTGGFGFNPTADVRIETAYTANGQAYCLAASHTSHDEVWYLGTGGTLSSEAVGGGSYAEGCPVVEDEGVGAPVPASS